MMLVVYTPDGSGNFNDAYKALKHYITTYNSYNPGTKVTISKDNLKNISQITKFLLKIQVLLK